MKIFTTIWTLLCGLLIMTTSSFSQTVITNWVMATPNFREVNGKLYDVDKSTNWQIFKIRVLARTSNVVEAVYLKQHFHRAAASGNGSIGGYSSAAYLVPDGYFNDHQIQVTNCAVPTSTESGIVAMRIGFTPNGYEIWDCGKPHIIAALKTNSTAIAIK